MAPASDDTPKTWFCGDHRNPYTRRNVYEGDSFRNFRVATFKTEDAAAEAVRLHNEALEHSRGFDVRINSTRSSDLEVAKLLADIDTGLKAAGKPMSVSAYVPDTAELLPRAQWSFCAVNGFLIVGAWQRGGARVYRQLPLAASDGWDPIVGWKQLKRAILQLRDPASADIAAPLK